ncbi:zinc-binding dehydrogenase [Microdochium nivale]|nr:zinc-binding dehydrogenase [Microdochium nivale]
MLYLATYSAWRRSAGTRGSSLSPLTLHLRHDEKLPQPQELDPHDVVIKIHAVSLNYRDNTMLSGEYPFPLEDGGVPCSDAAGQVVATGTGGVSMVGLAFCIAARVRGIITSSSDEKLEAVKKLSPLVQGINYKTTKSIPEEVKRLTDGRGVNYVVSTAGFAGLIDDIETLSDSGTISLVGAFGGMDSTWHPAQLD